MPILAGPCTAGATSARDAITQCVDALRKEAPGVREGSVDAVHTMRIASRRLRAAMKAFAPYADSEQAAALVAQAKAVTQGLGRVREVDVLIAMLEEWRRDYYPPWNFAAGHAAGVLRTERESLQARCAEVAAMADDVVFTQAVTTVDGDACLRVHMAGELRDCFDGARAAYKHWRTTGDGADLHEVRKALKRLRYTCELFAPHYGKNLKQYIKTLKATQDALGEWNDRRILCKTLDLLEAGAPYRAAQGFPELVRDAEEETQDAAKAVRKAARRLLNKDARKAARAIFDTPKVTCCAPDRGEKE